MHSVLNPKILKGDEMLMEVYKDLGGPEVQDQVRKYAGTKNQMF